MAAGNDSDWPVHKNAEVIAEYIVKSSRIDIVIVATDVARCMVIEVNIKIFQW